MPARKKNEKGNKGEIGKTRVSIGLVKEQYLANLELPVLESDVLLVGLNRGIL